MTVYIINILLIAVFGIVLRLDSKVTYQKRLRFYLLALFVWWVVLYTFRYRVGADSWTFNASFELFVRSKESFGEFMQSRRDWAFSLIYWFFIKVLGFNRVAFYAVMGVLCYAPFLLAVEGAEEDAEDIVFILLLYVFTLTFYTGYNGTRQAIATGFLTLGYYRFFRKKRFWAYAVCMVLAAGFHAAALFAIPFHLLSRKRVDSALNLSVIGVMLITVAFLPSVWASIIDFLDMIGQEKMANDYLEYQAKGAHVLRLVVATAPAALSFVKRNDLRELYGENVDGEIFLAIISAVFMAFSTRTAILARVSGIMGITVVFIVPKLCNTFRRPELFRLLVGLLYFAYMVMLLRAGDSHYYPYQFLPNINATW